MLLNMYKFIDNKNGIITYLLSYNLGFFIFLKIKISMSITTELIMLLTIYNTLQLMCVLYISN